GAPALIKSAKWTLGPELPDPAKIYDVLLALPTEDIVISDKQASMPEGAKVIEATYRKPYIAHASIGPSCALAEFKDGKMTVWTHAQGVFPLRNDLSLSLKLPVSDIRCIHAEGSGCYGHNGADDVSSTPPCSRGPWLLVPCDCNGCGTTSSAGSHMG